jgi:hypothetical protein
MDGKRSFTAAIGARKAESGRYLSTTPSGAARKAANRYFNDAGKGSGARVQVAVRETTRGSAGKTFKYTAKRVADHDRATINGCNVYFRFRTELKASK